MPPCCSCICGANIRASGIINHSVTIGPHCFDISLIRVNHRHVDKNVFVLYFSNGGMV